LHHTGAYPERPADLQDAIALCPQFLYSRLDGWLGSTPAQLRPVRPSAGEACINSFSNDASLKLGKHAEHLKHRLARGGGEQPAEPADVATRDPGETLQ
jgi:hypothetical protein